MVRCPLSRINRIRLARLFHDCPRVDISIDCILNGQMGKAYADNLLQPRAAMLQTGAFCYFGGDVTNADARKMMQRFPDHTILMPSTPGWYEVFKEIHQNRVIAMDRYQFDATPLRADHLEHLLNASPHRESILPIDEDMAGRMIEDGLLLADLTEFETGSDFAARGIGYYIPSPMGVAAVAYSSLASNDAIEISIFVQPELRRRGIATALGSQLILTALQEKRLPHWDAANLPSRALAQKLGYRYTGLYRSLCLDS